MFITNLQQLGLTDKQYSRIRLIYRRLINPAAFCIQIAWNGTEFSYSFSIEKI